MSMSFKWLKYQTSHAAGLGEPQYIELVTSKHTSFETALEHAMYVAQEEQESYDGGTRSVQTEVLDQLPEHEFRQVLKEAEDASLRAAAQLYRYKREAAERRIK